MPHPSSLAMLINDPDNYRPPMSMEQARKQGFVDFTFYPSQAEATRAASSKAYETGRKTVTFSEVARIGDKKYVLHVVGETERPRPVVRQWVERTREDETARMNRLRGFRANMDRPTCPPRAKLNAFAIFIAEWAAKLRRVSR